MADRRMGRLGDLCRCCGVVVDVGSREGSVEDDNCWSYRCLVLCGVCSFLFLCIYIFNLTMMVWRISQPGFATPAPNLNTHNPRLPLPRNPLLPRLHNPLRPNPHLPPPPLLPRPHPAHRPNLPLHHPPPPSSSLCDDGGLGDGDGGGVVGGRGEQFEWVCVGLCGDYGGWVLGGGEEGEGVG